MNDIKFDPSVRVYFPSRKENGKVVRIANIMILCRLNEEGETEYYSYNIANKTFTLEPNVLRFLIENGITSLIAVTKSENKIKIINRIHKELNGENSKGMELYRKLLR